MQISCSLAEQRVMESYSFYHSQEFDFDVINGFLAGGVVNLNYGSCLLSSYKIVFVKNDIGSTHR